MKVCEVPFKLQLTHADGSAMGVGRSIGRHLSDILEHMRRAAGEGATWGGDARDMYAAIGFMFERHMNTAASEYWGLQRGTILTQTETRLNNIYMTPDQVNLEDGFLEEAKVTWKSIKKLATFERDFWYYLTQLKANCLGQGTLKARMMIIFLNGDYRPPKPMPICLEFEFTQAELDDNWEAVLSYATELDTATDK